MLRPRARVGHASTVLRVPRLLPRLGRGLVPGLVLGVLLVTAGCGSDDSEKEGDEPSKAALECQAKWKDLKADVDGEESKTNPSALAPRWNSIGAAVEHYATSAKADDCGKTLDDEKKAMAALAAFVTKLKPYDMELRLGLVKDDAGEYASSPRPPAPKPSPAKKGKKAKKEPRPPKPADIKAALATLTKQAPLATDQQAPAWQQARAVELEDAAAVKKAIKDLAFISSESKAYRTATAALAEIRPALAANEE
jgi:hypothetical protein